MIPALRFPPPPDTLPRFRRLSGWACLLGLALCGLAASPASAHAQTGGTRAGTTRAATGETACRQDRVASIALQETGYYLTATARIHGRALSMIVDTGSEGSLLTPDALSQLHLSPDEGEGAVISGPDGHGHVVPTIQPASLTLGQVTFTRPVLPLGTLPGFPAMQPPVLGLIGMNLLGRYDLDIDLPHHRLTLWDPRHIISPACPQPAPWPAGRGTALAAERIRGRFFIPFTLDGKTGIALMDSGARSHIISMDFVRQLGITQDVLARDPGGASAGIGDREHAYHWHRFGRLTLGGQSQPHPVLTVTPLHEQADMLLGADWLIHHRLWLSAGPEGAVFLWRTDRRAERTGDRETDQAKKIKK